MTALILDAAQRRDLRAQAHHLDPVVMIGGDGLTDAVLREADAALRAHGLIKVRALAEGRGERESLLAALADQLGAAPVQHIGKLLVLWRPIPPKPKAQAEDRRPGPRLVKVLKPARSATHRPTIKKLRLLGNERVTTGGLVKRKRVRLVSPKKKQAG